MEAKRARLNYSYSSSLCWTDLEPGVWERVLQSLRNIEDKQNARLVCKLFSKAASCSIHQLALIHEETDHPDILSKMAVST